MPGSDSDTRLDVPAVKSNVPRIDHAYLGNLGSSALLRAPLYFRED
jgi:hypothetical protein